MQRLTFTIMAAVFSITLCFSQDLITKKSGEDIQAKIIEIGSTELKYKKFDNPEGPTFTLLKSSVLMVRYANGTKDIFNEIEETQGEKPKLANINLSMQGKQDALMNYRGRNSGAGWTAATTILFTPLIGFIPAVACASSKPADWNLNYKDSELMKDYEYNRAYVEQAHKTKKKKVWKAFGISSGVYLFLAILALQ